ncbi:hypothetical protein S40288_07612 [Stachybotrys chartarum IBT 40288]|nr:hypothetical protein S40288_07612 [Stachybotrys chartarum IBT 40288]
MDPASTASDLPQRAASTDAPGTRPNPFDDKDASSRKRRRTSGSGSPTPNTLEAASTPQPASSPVTLDGSTSPTNGCMKMESPTAPRTPEPPQPQEHLATETPSSRITINLRNPSHTDAASSGAGSTTPDNSSLARENDTDMLKHSVEDTDANLAIQHRDGTTTPQSSSGVSASPAIEILAMNDEEDDDDDDDDDIWLSEIHAPVDPTHQFPYVDSGESLSDTVHRLAEFISTQSQLNADVLDQVQSWMKLYLSFLRHADTHTVARSCQANRTFWLTLPEVFQALISRKYVAPPLSSLLINLTPSRAALLRSPEIDLIGKHIYSSFIKLTAAFVDIDCRTCHALQQSPTRANSQLPELLSIGFLRQLHGMTYYDEPPFGPDQPRTTASSSTRARDAEFFLQRLLATNGDRLESLCNLALAVTELVPTNPKLADSLGPVCNVIADILRSASLQFFDGQQHSVQMKQGLERGYTLWSTISPCLETMIEKQVTHLSSDGTLCNLQSLSEILRYSLSGDHTQAVELLEDHRHRYPELAHKHTADAIAWAWRFDSLGKLIRSSQMQLRVMAVTTMCGELVAIWKRLCDVGIEESTPLTEHFGEYLRRSNIIDYILSANCHPEIIVESANIIGFLVVAKLYRPEHTDRLWQAITSSQDPRISDALTRMITSIIALFEYHGLVGICEKLQTLPIEGFTSSIRILWNNVMLQMIQKYQTVQDLLTYHPFDLCLRLMRDSCVFTSDSQIAHPEIHSATMQRFKDLLSHGPDQEGKRRLYENCIKDISAKSPTTLGSLWCLSMAMRPSLAYDLQDLTANHDFAAIIVGELEQSIKVARAASVSTVLCGSPNQPRKDFLANIIYHQPRMIRNELGAKLWSMLVGPLALCREDRMAGWDIILEVFRQVQHENVFLQACLSEYLPSLPPACFCEGMLDLIRERVLFLVADPFENGLDEADGPTHSAIEDLWRVILLSENDLIANRAIHTLAVEVYTQSNSITSYPFQRARQAHLSLVNRCLEQLKGAARWIRATSESLISEDDDTMVIVTVDEDTLRRERIYIRSLKLLRYFMEAHHSNPRFAAPDIRSLMSSKPQPVEGDPAQLMYQSFDGSSQTEVKPLSIGKLNTAASLLASLRQETGFQNYRVYYRGQPFLPTEYDICRSLEDLHVHDGLMLIQREAEGAMPPIRIKPGSSPLEIEILTHFSELWDCLSMDRYLAKEIYGFLITLPADGHILARIGSDETSYADIFPQGEVYKSLYALHALREFVEGARQSQNPTQTLSIEGTRAWDTSCGPPPDCLVTILSIASTSIDETGHALVNSTLNAILRLGLLDAGFWSSVVACQGFSDVLRRLILLDTRPALRTGVVKMIEETVAIEYHNGHSDHNALVADDDAEPGRLAHCFWVTLRNFLPEAVIKPDQSQAFFHILQYLLMTLSDRTPAIVDLQDLAKQTSDLLLAHASTETIDQPQPHDVVADGLISLLHTIVQLDKGLTSSSVLPSDLPETLFSQHLFPSRRPQAREPIPRVILNTQTRSRLCAIILQLVGHDLRQLRQLLEALNELVPVYAQDERMQPRQSESLHGYSPANVDDPYHYELPYGFDRTDSLRSTCGYVGLRNLSNTCYLNSLLTQLFMNTGFRRFFMSPHISHPTDSQRLLFHTQKLFGYMQDSYRRFVDPTDLVSCIKTFEDAPIDVHNQMDVDEFYSLLFDRWESQLSGDHERKLLRSFFGGQLVQQMKSKECDHISERLEPFSAIQCDIKGKTTLQDSLQAYVDGEIMEGDNKYKCSTCDRHVDAVKRLDPAGHPENVRWLMKSRACLKDIPDNLIFHLKRFDFNLRTLQRSKINDYFSFPAKIDMRPYTIEHLSDDRKDDGEDIFELVGILVHSGTAESGHYYSYIRERQAGRGGQSWVEFNDETVTPWDPNQMEASTFGGPDRSSYEPSGMIYDKSYSAYMLFYQRSSALRREEAALEADAGAPNPVGILPELQKHILNENTVMLRRHCLFDPSHAVFVQECIRQVRHLDSDPVGTEGLDDGVPGNRGQSFDLRDLKDLAMQVALGHLDQVVSRTKDLPNWDQWSVLVNEAVTGCGDCAFAYYNYFKQRQTSFRAMLQRNPDARVRTFAGQTLIRALKKVSLSLPQVYYPPRAATASPGIGNSSEPMDVDTSAGEMGSGVPVIEGAMHLFNYLWRFFHMHIRSWDEYFGTLVGFAKLGQDEVAHLLAGDYLFNALRIVGADEVLGLPLNYTKMLVNISRRQNNTRTTSYSAVIVLIDYLLHQLEPVLGQEVIVESPEDRLGVSGAVFPWTTDEVMFILQHPNRQTTGLFIEKLLSLDQAQASTDNIVSRLVRTGPKMDESVCGVLHRTIQGATSAQPMDPFLRAAATYIECTEVSGLGQSLIYHVSGQAKHLQNSEGIVFLDFVRTALELKSRDDDTATFLRDSALTAISDWAPCLFVYGDDKVRLEAERLVEETLFHTGLQDDLGADEGSMERKELIEECIQRLGVSCLIYVRDAYVKRRAHISREKSLTVQRMLAKCAEAYSSGEGAAEDLQAQFEALESDVMPQFRRLVVEEIDDDNSGDQRGGRSCVVVTRGQQSDNDNDNDNDDNDDNDNDDDDDDDDDDNYPLKLEETARSSAQ